MVGVDFAIRLTGRMDIGVPHRVCGRDLPDMWGGRRGNPNQRRGRGLLGLPWRGRGRSGGRTYRETGTTNGGGGGMLPADFGAEKSSGLSDVSRAESSCRERLSRIPPLL